MAREKSYRLSLIVCLLIINSVVAQQPRLVVPVGHTDDVLEAKFSPDGKSIATASYDQTIKIWDAGTGRLLQTLYGHKASITTIDFSSQGNYLLSSAIDDSSTRLWNLHSGKEMLSLKRVGFQLEQAWLSKDEKNLFVLEEKGVAMWDVLTGKQIGSFSTMLANGNYKSVTAASVSNDGRQLAVMMGYYDSILVFNIPTKQLNKKLRFDKELYGLKKIAFSVNDKLIYVFSTSNFRGIEIATGKIKFKIGYNNELMAPALSSDGRYFFIAGQYQPYSVINNDTVENTAREVNIYQPAIFDLQTLTTKLLKGDAPTQGRVRSVCFDKTGSLLAVTKSDGVFVFKMVSGKLVKQLVIDSKIDEDNYYADISISPDGKNILLSNRYLVSMFSQQGKFMYSLNGSIAYDDKQYFSSKEEVIFTSTGNKKGFSWDILNGKIISLFDTTTRDDNKVIERKKKEQKIADSINRSNKKIVGGDTLESIMDMKNYIFSELSPSGKYVVTWSGHDSLGKVWSADSGKLLYQVRSHYGDFTSVIMSGDEQHVVFMNNNELNAINRMWDNLEREINGDTTTKAISENYPAEMKVLNLSSGKLLLTIEDTSNHMYFRGPSFSTDSRYFSFPGGEEFKVWDAATWKVILSVANPCRYDQPYEIAASPDGKKIILTCASTAYLYETISHQLLFTLPGSVKSAKFSNDGKYILTQSDDKQMRVYTASNAQLMYTFYAFENGNFIVTDKFDRYDGTEEARKNLYYVCGNEFIDLNQFKDQLWVPNLAERIMSGDSINAPHLSDLNICGLTPETEEKNRVPGIYHFIIRPRRGGLGETVLYVNGIEVRRFKPASLKQTGNTYELVVKKEELQTLFTAGKENQVTIKAYTADNIISSRGLIIKDTVQTRITVSPNLYAVMIGVSDYKGDELDLKYAAKDATDISSAVSTAARKLLNKDEKEHVFTYNLTTATNRYQLPEKNSIKRTLEEIGRKATANDILLIFFAGHGVMAGEKKQFYFLTADASGASATDAIADVGISTAELTEWMKPQHIKAQKRILIVDGCNSGQAIKDFVKLGKEEQEYTAARNDEKGQQIKAIEKLNEQSGLFILSASASNQNAYEMGRYSQGLLTYSLLKAIKMQPDILQDGKYLDVSRWFNAAEKTVSELTKDNGARQQPQIFSNTNFNIGIVDEEVMAKIVLPQEKPLFTNSNLQNTDENIAMDDLGLNKILDEKLSDISSRGNEGVIAFSANIKSADAYALGGRYEIKGSAITARINIRQGKEIKFRFEVAGTTDKLNELIAAIAEKATLLTK